MMLVIMRLVGKGLFDYKNKRPHPELNRDVRKDPGFEPGAIPLCDAGISLVFDYHCIHSK